jgi:hypothetical protein
LDRENWFKMHAFNHAPAALRIFRFVADTVPRALEIAHVSKFLRECADDFDGIGAVLPIALQNEYAAQRYFKLRRHVERRFDYCPWLMEKILACRNIASIPLEALKPNVRLHDVRWGVGTARRNPHFQVTHGGYGIMCEGTGVLQIAQGPLGVRSGKHWFAIISPGVFSHTSLGWIDDQIALFDDWPNKDTTLCSGADYTKFGIYGYGTGCTAGNSVEVSVTKRPCVLGCLLDLDSTPARMTIFVDGKPLSEQCEYDFPKDGRLWYPTVSLRDIDSSVISCAT